MRFALTEGAYEIDSMPSQPQVAHCHGFFVYHELRGMGHAHTLKQHQWKTLRDLGYDYATCTVCSSNAAQKRVLERSGWSKLAEFTSSKTGEPVELWGCALQEEELESQTHPRSRICVWPIRTIVDLQLEHNAKSEGAEPLLAKLPLD